MTDYNFNKPLRLTEIFRIREEAEQDVPSPKAYSDSGNNIILPASTSNRVRTREFAFEHCIGWEDIRAIKQYMHVDDWIQNKGDKYYLALQGHSEDILILGNYQSMVAHWTMFRDKFPLFRG